VVVVGATVVVVVRLGADDFESPPPPQAVRTRARDATSAVAAAVVERGFTTSPAVA
jgi:hypothetical protein